jgi:hypothetical protein
MTDVVQKFHVFARMAGNSRYDYSMLELREEDVFERSIFARHDKFEG